MLQILASRNDDLKRLLEKGYAVAFDTNHLIVRDIPYLDAELTLQSGAIVTQVSFIDKVRVQQQDHQIFFAGSHPHGLDGTPIRNMGGGPATVTLSEVSRDVVVARSFSMKPRAAGKYIDFFEKIETYVAIISGPAMEKYDASPYTYRVVSEDTSESVFKFQDTLTTRAEITDLSAKFKEEVIAIIGLGGTGSYLLDFIAKTPVKEVRAYDLDAFHVHNAFRSPGRLEESELGKTKAEVYLGRYENFRTGLQIVPRFIDTAGGDEFEGVTFAFVCVDKGSSRAEIIDLLIAKDIPFIDVGMGLNRKHEALGGMVRTTLFPRCHGAEVRSQGLVDLSDRPDDLYKSNIQISELNALNASLAVIRYKQLRGFYFNDGAPNHLLFRVGDLGITGLGGTDEN